MFAVVNVTVTYSESTQVSTCIAVFIKIEERQAFNQQLLQIVMEPMYVKPVISPETQRT